MTIMDVAGPVIEEERAKAKKWIMVGIQGMAEMYAQFAQPQEVAQKAILEKYDGVDEDLINSIIADVYGNKH